MVGVLRGRRISIILVHGQNIVIITQGVVLTYVDDLSVAFVTISYLLVQRIIEIIRSLGQELCLNGGVRV